MNQWPLKIQQKLPNQRLHENCNLNQRLEAAA